MVISISSLTSAQAGTRKERSSNPLEQNLLSDEKVITDELAKYMDEASDDELIPVTVELKSDLDLEEVNKIASMRANISMEEISAISNYSLTLNDEEKSEYQQVLMECYDRISLEENNIVKEYFQKLNMGFLEENGLADNQYHSIGIFTPFIRKIYLTKEQILSISESEEVCYIYYSKDVECVDYASIEFSYKIIGGNVAVESGYTGKGIRVGDVESGHPDFSIMGNDSANINKTNAGSDTAHSARVCGIIKKMAPDCTIYTRAASKINDIFKSCEWLIDTYNVHVINLSCGSSLTGSYDLYSRQIDGLVKNRNVTIVVAAGNGDASTEYVNAFGMAPNAITVGGVSSYGGDPTVATPYSFRDNSLYREAINCVNKPEISAPGTITIYGASVGGTSFSAPHITGTIVQMLSRNASLMDEPQTLKAALMASASFNGGTSMSYVTGTVASNEEGAGVVDAGFCYKVAGNGQRDYFHASSTSDSFVRTITCSDVTKPLRIACAWEVLSTDSSTNCTDYDMRLYKNGTLVASSLAYSNATQHPNTNYEIIVVPTSVLNTYGAGNYEIRITKVSNFRGSGIVRIGLAWGQR